MLPYLRWWRPLCVANGITRPCDNTRVPRRGGSRRGAVSGGMLRVHRWGRSERRGCGCRCSRASVLGTRAYVWEQLPRGSQQLCCRMPFPYSGLPELHLARPHRHQLAGRSGGPSFGPGALGRRTTRTAPCLLLRLNCTLAFSRSCHIQLATHVGRLPRIA